MFRFKDASIGSKLALGFGVLVIILLVFGIFSVLTMGRIHRSTVEIETNWLPASIALGQIDARTADFRLKEYEMVAEKNLAKLPQFQTYWSTLLVDIKKAFAEFVPTITGEKEKELHAIFSTGWDEYLKIHETKLLPLIQAGKFDEADKLLDESESIYDKFTKSLMEDIAYNKQGGENASNASQKMYAQATVLTMIAIILTIFISVGIAILITRAISNPVKAVADYADNLAKTGDLSKEILIPGVTLKEGQASQSKDEATLMAGAFSRLVDNLRTMAKQAAIVAAGDLTQEVTGKGDLPTAFNTMVRNLKDLVIKVLQTAQHVSVSSQQLSSSAQQINATTQEVSSTVQQIAKGAEATAQRVEETSKVMEQMGSSVAQVATSSQQTAAAATQANTSAQSGGEAVKETVKTMEKIFGATSASSVVVKKLGEKAEEIGKIVDVITDIADQTNLLALNAAIEAARAGEAGRGFAVVAEEVRKLAEGASKSSDEIASLIKEANKDIESAVKSMDDSNKEVVQGKEVVAKAETAFAEILKAAGNAATMVQQVSAATQQMASGSKQVVKSIDEIASSAEEAASATEQASASTEQMTASMEEMAASAQELANMAIELRELVGKFKTGAEVEKEVYVVKGQGSRIKGEEPKDESRTTKHEQRTTKPEEKKPTPAVERLKAVRERIHKEATEKG